MFPDFEKLTAFWFEKAKYLIWALIFCLVGCGLAGISVAISSLAYLVR